MKKILFTLLFVLSFTSLFATQKDKTSFKDDGDDVIEIDVNYTPPVTGPKRSPAIVPISATYYVALSYIEVSFLYNMGDISIVLTDLASNSTMVYNSDTSIGTVFIPFNSGSGVYSIEFITSSGETYSGVFII